MVAGMSVRGMQKARMRKGKVQRLQAMEDDQGWNGQAPAGKIGGMERRYRI